MDIITLNKENIDKEHICCAISDKKGENRISSKKEWLKKAFADGLIFKKLDERGKVFIEYIPAEDAWTPIIAPNYMYINCFWVSGKFAGNGYANALLEECIQDAKLKCKDGLVILSSKKKKPFLSDPRFLKYKGFEIADTAQPDFELLYLRFNKNSVTPKFKDCAKLGKIKESGMVLYYTNQCPHTDMYAPLIGDIAKENDKEIKLIKITSKEEAQNSPSPFTTYSFFDGGKFVTNEILTPKKFIKYLESKRQDGTHKS